MDMLKFVDCFVQVRSKCYLVGEAIVAVEQTGRKQMRIYCRIDLGSHKTKAYNWEHCVTRMLEVHLGEDTGQTLDKLDRLSVGYRRLVFDIVESNRHLK